MSKVFRQFIIPFVVFVILELPLFVFNCSAMNLVIRDHTRDEKVLREFIISANERFALKYTHSVDRLPVEEWFEITSDGSIYLVEVRFIQLPYLIVRLPHESPLIYTYSPPWTIVSNIKREIKLLDIRVSYFTEQYLLVQDTKVKLADYVDDGGLIHIDVKF